MLSIDGHTPLDIINHRIKEWSVIWAFADEEASKPFHQRQYRHEGQAYFGDVYDVSLRRWEASKLYPGIEYWALLGADDFLIAPEALKLAFEAAVYLRADYVWTQGWPLGCNVPVVSKRLLEIEAKVPNEPEEHEHATLYFDRHPNDYPVTVLHRPDDASDLRVTLDYSEDYKLMSHLVHRFGIDVTTDQIVRFLRDNPLWQVSIRHDIPIGRAVRSPLMRVTGYGKMGDL